MIAGQKRIGRDVQVERDQLATFGAVAAGLEASKVVPAAGALEIALDGGRSAAQQRLESKVLVGEE
jgi:hypothetical protein